jgi:hypothetical protein
VDSEGHRRAKPRNLIEELARESGIVKLQWRINGLGMLSS